MSIGGQFIETEPDEPTVVNWSARTAKKSSITSNLKDGAWYERKSMEYLEFRRSFEGFWNTVEDGYRRYGYEPKGGNREQLSEVYPGRIYRIVHMTEASVLGPGLKFFAEGYNPLIGEEGVELLEDLVNADWATETRVMKEMRLCARDAAKFGFGIAFTSYEADFEKVSKADRRAKDRQLAVEDPAMFATRMALESEVAKQAAFGAEKFRQPTFERDARVLREDIVTRRLSPWHFGVDPDATCLEDAQSVWRYVFAPIEAVQNYDLFENTEDLAPTPYNEYQRVTNREATKEHNNRGGRSSNKILLQERFERTEDGRWRMIVAAHGHPKLLRVAESPYWIGHPFAMLSWNDDGDCIFPQSDILPVYSEILAERLVQTKAVDGFSRQAEDTTFYAKDTIKEEKITAIAQPEVGKYIPVDVPQGMSLQQIVTRLPASQQTGEVMAFIAMLERSMMQSAGFSPNQFGQALKSGTSASESNSIASYSTQAQAHKLGGMELFLSRVTTQRLGLACQFYTDGSQIARVLGAGRIDTWIKMKLQPSDVQNGLRVCLKPGSTQPVSDQVRAGQLVSVLQLVAGDQIANMMVNKPELYRQLFRALGFHDGSKLLLTNDAVDVQQATMAMAARGTGSEGGSAPAVSGAPTGDAGAAQMIQS